MKISRMSLENVPDVTRLASQLGYPVPEADIRRRFQELAQNTTHAIFVASDEASGEILGWIQANREPDTILTGPRAEVSGLIVDETTRSQGVGAKLLEVAEMWAREQGLSLMRVRSNVKRERAHQFYLREGYKIEKTGHLFTKPLS